MAHAFLSDEWLDAVSKLAAEAGGGVMPDSVSLNMVVTGSPQGDRELHIADGTLAAGLNEGAPTKLTMPYAVAKNMFVTGDQSAVMQAFMTGQIKVEGDMSKLMAMQSAGPGGADAAALQQKLREITADD